jgi:hypothetical protein
MSLLRAYLDSPRASIALGTQRLLYVTRFSASPWTYSASKLDTTLGRHCKSKPRHTLEQRYV